MARIRTVKPEFFQHEELGALPFAARLLAIGLMQIADGHGRFRWVPKSIDSHVFPWDDVDLEALAAGLEVAGILVRYEVDGRRFGAFPNFRKHQRITGKEHALESKYPHPDKATTVMVNPRGNRRETQVKQPAAQEQGTGNREQGPPKPPSGGQASLIPESDPVAQVHAGYMEGRKGRGPSLDGEFGKFVRDRLNRKGPRRVKGPECSVEDLVLISRWTLVSSDNSAQLLRDGGNTKYETIYKATRFEARLMSARAWARDGAPKAKPAPGSVTGLTPDQWWDSSAGGKRACSEALALFDANRLKVAEMLDYISKRDGAPSKAWLEPKVEAWKDLVREQRKASR